MSSPLPSPTPPAPKTWRDCVLAWREQYGHTQKEAAENLGVPYGTLAGWEGHRDAKLTSQTLAVVLRVAGDLGLTSPPAGGTVRERLEGLETRVGELETSLLTSQGRGRARKDQNTD